MSDGGPNNGVNYVTSVTNSGQISTAFSWLMNVDLASHSGPFWNAQCGNYNASSNPNGFISGANLSANTIRHESSQTAESHWINYQQAQNNSSNNLGAIAEGLAQSGSTQTFVSYVTSTLNRAWPAILSATKIEPYDVQHNASDVFQGYTNYKPYASCQ